MLNRNFCAVSDKNYLTYGINMYNSLLEHCKDFTLYYLCMDDFTYEYIKEKKFEHIVPVVMSEVKNTEKFKVLEKNTVYNPMGDNTYCWALASFFSEYVVTRFKLPEIMYVDCDICFYNNVDEVYDFVSQKSIGIMLHRHNDLGCHVGAYNVGLIYFKSDNIGYDCLTWWRDCVIDTNNEWVKEYGTCGDQKYLEAFEKEYGKENICIIDEEIGHGAPWNMGLYQYLDNNLGGEFIWKPINHQGGKVNLGFDFEFKKQKIYFVHFAQFTPDYKNNSFSFDRSGAWRGCKVYDNPSVIKYYIDYFIKNQKLYMEIK